MYTFRRIKRLSLFFLLFFSLVPPTNLHAGKGGVPGIAESLSAVSALTGSVTAGLGAGEGTASMMTLVPYVMAAPFYTVTLPIIGGAVSAVGVYYFFDKVNGKIRERRRLRREEEYTRKYGVSESSWKQNFYPNATPRVVNGEAIPAPSTPGDGSVSLDDPRFPWGPNYMGKKSDPKKSETKKDDKDENGDQGHGGKKGPGIKEPLAGKALQKTLEEKNKEEYVQPLSQCTSKNTTESEALARCPQPNPQANPETCLGKTDNLKDAMTMVRKEVTPAGSPGSDYRITPHVGRKGSFEGLINGQEIQRTSDGKVVGIYRLDTDPGKGTHINYQKWNEATKKWEKGYVGCDGVSGQAATNALRSSNTVEELQRAKTAYQHKANAQGVRAAQVGIERAQDHNLRSRRFDFVENTIRFAIKCAKTAAGVITG